MASSSDLEAVPVHVEVEQPAEACDSGSGSATTTTEESEAVVQEQHGTAPEPDHHDAAAPEQAAEVSPWKEPEEEKQPVAKEERELKAPGDDHQESTRERLKRHRQEMAGRVWVPEMWGQEKLLKDWVDCAVFDRPLVPTGLLTARRALIAECCTRRPDRTSTAASAGSGPLRVQNGCI
ncbi:protein BIC1-like [Phragmites australis]|uniref:protein BIC1-like n=1 Tax=Phragmites australis TaxID=29695 RepID=UPI002D783C01|nr:protein BIC1-like [Phragmites australis]